MGTDSKTELLQQLKIDRTPPPPTQISVPLLIVACGVTALLTAVAVFLLLPESESATSTASAPPQVQTSRVQTSKVQTQSTATVATEPSSVPPANRAALNASGYITARRVATVSAEIMGRIVAVDVEEGMQVEEGQPLAQLDDAIARVDLELAEANRDAYRARINSYASDLAEAQRVLDRYTRLNTFTSEAQLTRAQADVARLTSNLASARADLNVAEFQVDRQQEALADHTVRAPFSGIVTVKNAQPGEIVAPAAAGGGFTRTGICTIVDMASLEIEVDVNEAFIGRVFSGQKVIANLDAYPDWDIPASVIAIIPTADRAKATVAVRIKIHSRDARILPNMGVKVAFFDGQAEG